MLIDLNYQTTSSITMKNLFPSQLPFEDSLTSRFQKQIFKNLLVLPVKDICIFFSLKGISSFSWLFPLGYFLF